MSLTLEAKDTGNFVPHPDGIFPAICIDVVDLGMQAVTYENGSKSVHKIKLVFETEERLADGTACTVSKNFTASLHKKAKLSEFLGKWRGQPVVTGEKIDLEALKGKCATLVVSHQVSTQGRPYASIDAITKTTKAIVASGQHDPIKMRETIAAYQAKQTQPAPPPAPAPAPASKIHDDDVPF